MTGAVLSFTLMEVAGREIEGRHDTFEIMFYRSVLGILFVLAAGGMAGTLGQIRTDRLPLHLVRNISHFAGQNLWFYALTLIPMAQLFSLEFTTPLWVALLAPLVLGETWRTTRLLAAVLGFAGLLFVARPGMVDIGPGMIAAIFCAWGFAGAILCTKMLSRHESVTSILFWLVVTQAVFGLITVLMDGKITWPSAQTAPFLAVIAFCGLFSHFCITNALRVAPASVVSPMEFTRLPLVAVVASILYLEPLQPVVFLGAAIVFGANLMNILSEQRRQKVLA